MISDLIKSGNLNDDPNLDQIGICLCLKAVKNFSSNCLVQILFPDMEKEKMCQ